MAHTALAQRLREFGHRGGIAAFKIKAQAINDLAGQPERVGRSSDKLPDIVRACRLTHRIDPEYAIKNHTACRMVDDQRITIRAVGTKQEKRRMPPVACGETQQADRLFETGFIDRDGDLPHRQWIIGRHQQNAKIAELE